MIKISDFLDPGLVLFLTAKNRDEVIKAMVDTLNEQGKLGDQIQFYDAIIEREKVVTTGIGMNVAIPHAKLPTLDQFFISIAIVESGIDWNALDGSPVRLVFMIGGPDDKQTEYLQILSSLTLALKDDQRRKNLIESSTPEEVIELFQGR